MLATIKPARHAPQSPGLSRRPAPMRAHGASNRTPTGIWTWSAGRSGRGGRRRSRVEREVGLTLAGASQKVMVALVCNLRVNLRVYRALCQRPHHVADHALTSLRGSSPRCVALASIRAAPRGVGWEAPACMSGPSEAGRKRPWHEEGFRCPYLNSNHVFVQCLEQG